VARDAIARAVSGCSLNPTEWSALFLLALAVGGRTGTQRRS